MFERILVATDFSQGASAALDRALRIPLANGARIDVLHVAEDDDPHVATRLERELVRARAGAPATTARLGASFVRGKPCVEIIREARARDAELVVIGVHGKRWFRDLFVGSTAARVARMGDRPVLLVRRPATAAYRNALVALALTDVGPHLFELARRLGTPRPHVVHATHVPFEGFQTSTVAGRDELRAEYAKAAAAKLQAQLGAIEPGIWNATVRVGDARAVVLDEARRLETDLVICATHARSGLAHVLLGSVAETVIAMAPCDVLVARPPGFTFEVP